MFFDDIAGNDELKLIFQADAGDAESTRVGSPHESIRTIDYSDDESNSEPGPLQRLFDQP